MHGRDQCCAILKAMRGNTSIEEVLRVTLSDRRTRMVAEADVVDAVEST